MYKESNTEMCILVYSVLRTRFKFTDSSKPDAILSFNMSLGPGVIRRYWITYSRDIGTH